jgi:hypothetical protein
MGEARTRFAALVHQRKDVTRLVKGTTLPGFGDELELVRAGLRDRADVAWAVYDHLLPFESRIEVRHDAHLPYAVLR